MIQVQELTQQEKRKAFMELSKKQLVEMLIENNRIIDEFIKPEPEIFDYHIHHTPNYITNSKEVNYEIIHE